MLCYLDCVLKFGVLVVKHAEAQRFFRNNFHQHQVAALQAKDREFSSKYIYWTEMFVYSASLLDMLSFEGRDWPVCEPCTCRFLLASWWWAEVCQTRREFFRSWLAADERFLPEQARRSQSDQGPSSWSASSGFPAECIEIQRLKGVSFVYSNTEQQYPSQ